MQAVARAGGVSSVHPPRTGGAGCPWLNAVFLTFGLFFADEASHHFYDRSSFFLDHPAVRRDPVQAKQTKSLRVKQYSRLD
jgi:hypothetical protein